MSSTYSVVNTGDGGQQGTNVEGIAESFILDFVALDWTISGSDRSLSVAEATHGLGTELTVQVEELSGGIYSQVETVVENSNGNITILINDGLQFEGRIILKE